MAGPPAEMTPPLATVVRYGKADGHSINTVLAELASTGGIAFHNLDQVSETRSDDDPDPLTDPAIEIRGSRRVRRAGSRRPQRLAWDAIQRRGRRLGPPEPRAALGAELGAQRA